MQDRVDAEQQAVERQEEDGGQGAGARQFGGADPRAPHLGPHAVLFAVEPVASEEQQEAHEAVQQRPQHDRVVHPLREEPRGLAVRRGDEQPLRELRQRDVGHAGDGRAQREYAPEQQPSPASWSGQRCGNRVHQRLEDRKPQEQLRQRHEAGQGGAERDQSEQFLPVPDLIPARHTAVEVKHPFEELELVGGRFDEVRLERVQGLLVVDNPQRPFRFVAVEPAGRDVVDRRPIGFLAGVHQPQRLGRAAHVAVLQLVPVGAFVVEGVGRADVGSDILQDGVREAEDVAGHEHGVDQARLPGLLRLLPEVRRASHRRVPAR